MAALLCLLASHARCLQGPSRAMTRRVTPLAIAIHEYVSTPWLLMTLHVADDPPAPHPPSPLLTLNRPEVTDNTFDWRPGPSCGWEGARLGLIPPSITGNGRSVTPLDPDPRSNRTTPPPPITTKYTRIALIHSTMMRTSDWRVKQALWMAIGGGGLRLEGPVGCSRP